MARRVAEIESRDFDAGFYALVSPDVIKESGVSKVRLSVKNLNSVNIAADAVICGETGEILEIKPNITLDAGNAVDIEFNIAIPEDLPGRHYFYSVKLTDRNLPENKLLLSRAVYIDLPSMGPVDAVGLQGLVAVTPEENIFTVDGRRYLLIDAPGKGESAYFVMSLGNHGTRPFSADGTQRFNPSNPASVAYYLNNTPGLIPGNIAAYINRNHKWLTEGGYLGGDCPNDYYTTCGVALLSFAEFRANAGKIGLGDEIFTRWWLRTVRGANSWWDVGLVAREAQMRINEYALSSAAHIRPVFWLGEVFFKNVKISGAGENVLKALNPLELMSGGLYSPDEMAALCGDMPFDSFAASPQNSGINVTFTLKSGVDIDVLAAVYSGGSLVYAEFLTGGETPGFVPANTADTVKIMVWDNNMKPLFPALIYIAV
jgi:hypothetical protein